MVLVAAAMFTFVIVPLALTEYDDVMDDGSARLHLHWDGYIRSSPGLRGVLCYFRRIGRHRRRVHAIELAEVPRLWMIPAGRI
jgi:hypothetical protein